MNLLKIVTVFLLFGILIIACSSNKVVSNQGTNKIPEKVMKNAEDYIVSNIGMDNYLKFYEYDSLNSKRDENGNFFSYKLKVGDERFENLVHFHMDSLGNLISKFEIAGIPNCMADETAADFKLLKDDIIKVAKEDSFPEGIKDWKIRVIWRNEINRFVWEVISTEREIGKDDFYKASGKKIIVHPVTGEIINRDSWKIL